MIEYVAGFLTNGREVVLVKKLRPAWQKDRYNGVGGHIEEGELPENTMVREFFEETGVKTTAIEWWPFAVLSGEDWKVHFFFSHGDLTQVKTMTDEEIAIVPIKDITVYNSIPNLSWLIPMGFSIQHERTETFHIQENY